MYANAANLVALLTVASTVAPAFAAPAPGRNAYSGKARPANVNERSLKAVGAAVAGGIASGAAGAVVSGLFDKRDLMVDTETGIIYAEVPDAPEGRSLKAVGAAVAGGIASGAAGAVVSGLFDKRDGLMVDTETGIIYAEVPDAPNARSLKAVGAAVAGGIASGAAGAIVGGLFDKRSATSGLMVDTETGIIYAEVPDAPEGRSLKAVGAAVAGGIASGAAGAVVSSFFDKRDNLMVDTETGIIYLDTPDAPEARSLKAVGAAVAGGIASGAAGAVVSGLFDKRGVEGEFMVDTETGVIYLNTPEARSLKAVGAAVAGGIASGAAGAVVSGLFDKRSELMVDTETGVIYVNTPDAPEARSLKAVGAAVAGGIASGAAGAVVSGLFDKRSTGPALVFDDETGKIYIDKPERVQARSAAAIGKAIGNGLAAGTAEGGVGGAIKSLFNREAGDIYMDKAGVLYVDDGLTEKRSLKAVGAAVAGGIASGAAGAVVGSFFDKRMIDELD